MKSTKARLATAALLALGLLALFAGPASAMKQSVKIIHPAGGLTGTMYLEFGGVATDSAGNVYVRHAGYIEKYNSSGVFQSRFTAAGYKDIEVDPAGNIWTVEPETLRKYSPAGVLLKQVPVAIEQGEALAIDPSGNVWVLALYNTWEYNANAELINGIGHVDGGAARQTDIDIDSAGNMWASLYSHIQSPKATFSVFAGGISGDSSGNAWAVIPGSNAIVRKYSPTGAVLDSFGGTALGNMKYQPNVATGPAGAVWVATETQGLQKWVP